MHMCSFVRAAIKLTAPCGF